MQSSSAVVLETPKLKPLTVSIVSPSICHEAMGKNAMIFIFWMWNLIRCFTLLFHFHQEALQFLFTFCHVSSAYLRLLRFLQATVIPACASSSWAFCMIYSAYNLNNQGYNIQPLCTPFLIWNQSAVPSSVLTVASWRAYRFLRRQIR